MDEAVLANMSAHTTDLFNFEQVDADLRDALLALAKVNAGIGLLCDTKEPSDFDDFRPILWERISEAAAFTEPLHRHAERIAKWLPKNVVDTPISAETTFELILYFMAECRFCNELFAAKRETFPSNASDAGVLYDHLNFAGLPGLLGEVRTEARTEIREARRRYISETKTTVDHADLQKRLGNAADIAPATLNDKSPTKPMKRRRKSTNTKVNPLTPQQTEAIRLDGECKGNMSDVGRRMGISRQCAKQHLEAAYKKLGINASKKATTERLKTDRRGQEVVHDNHDDE